jgi:hypothetical protein
MPDTGVAEEKRVDRSISIARANGAMLLVVVPVMIGLVVLYAAVWSAEDFIDGLQRFLQWRIVIPTLLVGIPLHEAIHALGWIVAGGRPLRDIRFGFQWKTLTPYAHLQVRVPATVYRWGAAMPGLVLGILPYLVGLVASAGWLACLGLFFIFTAGGDWLVLWLLRGVDGRALTEDHPTRAGCYVYPLAGSRGET